MFSYLQNCYLKYYSDKTLTFYFSKYLCKNYQLDNVFPRRIYNIIFHNIMYILYLLIRHHTSLVVNEIHKHLKVQNKNKIRGISNLTRWAPRCFSQNICCNKLPKVGFWDTFFGVTKITFGRYLFLGLNNQCFLVRFKILGWRHK